MEVITNSTEQTKKTAVSVALNSQPGDVFALYGDLGSGKTTFTRYFVEALGITNRVQSPTFVIARKYESGAATKIKGVNHLDLYRIRDTKEIDDLNINELFLEPGFVTLIEWPQLVEKTLPKNTKRIYFEFVDENTRKIKIL